MKRKKQTKLTNFSSRTTLQDCRNIYISFKENERATFFSNFQTFLQRFRINVKL